MHLLLIAIVRESGAQDTRNSLNVEWMAIRRLVFKACKSYTRAKDVAFSPKYLFYTNVLLSVGISSLGDVLEQCYEVANEEATALEARRTAHMAFSGGTTGVISHHWYRLLDKVIVGKSFGMVIKKLMLDQFICSPVMILSFFATVAIFEENPIENFTEEVKEKFFILYKAEWLVWPPAQIINFYFLPTKYRVLYDNTISLGYDVYTSKVKHSKNLTVEKNHEKEEKK